MSPSDQDVARRKVRRLLLSTGWLLIALYIFVCKRALDLWKINNSLPWDISIQAPLGDGGVLWQRFLRLGAYAKDGKLYDGSGKEIKFFIVQPQRWDLPDLIYRYKPHELGSPGDQEHEESREAEEKKRATLEKECTVIYIQRETPL